MSGRVCWKTTKFEVVNSDFLIESMNLIDDRIFVTIFPIKKKNPAISVVALYCDSSFDGVDMGEILAALKAWSYRPQKVHFYELINDINDFGISTFYVKLDDTSNELNSTTLFNYKDLVKIY